MTSQPPRGPGPGPDPNDPVAEFVLGVADIFFNTQNQDPAQIKPRVDAMLARRPARPVPDGQAAEDFAETLVEAAWEAGEGGAELAIDALRVWPNCAHAYVLLGTEAGEELEIALALFTLGVTAGFEALGEEFVSRNAGQFWSLPETRPFMRALEGAAHTYWAMDAVEVAAAHFGQLVQLNPNDDQGARYPLLGCYLELGATDAAEALLASYGDDHSAAWAYGRALSQFQRGDESAMANAALRAALTAAPQVGAFIAETERPDDITSEDDPRLAELQLAQWFAGGFAETAGAMDWLRRNLSGEEPAELPKTPAKEKRSGPREV